MPVSSELSKKQYNGDGIQVVFPTVFQFATNAGVKVILTDAFGVDETWVEGTQYTITGAGDENGGDVTVETSPTDFTPQVNEVLTILRDEPNTQEAELPLGGPFPSPTVSGMSDLSTMQIQQNTEKFSRALKLPETAAVTEKTELPNATNRANKILAFDGIGDPIVSNATLAEIEAGAPAAAASAAEAAASAADALVSEDNAAASAALFPTIAPGDANKFLKVNLAEDAFIIGEGGGGQVLADVVVAASDATTAQKDGADLVCNGTNDQDEIQLALNNINFNTTTLIGHTFIITSKINLPDDNKIRGSDNTTIVADASLIGGVIIEADGVGGGCEVSNLILKNDVSLPLADGIRHRSQIKISNVTFKEAFNNVITQLSPRTILPNVLSIYENITSEDGGSFKPTGNSLVTNLSGKVMGIFTGSSDINNVHFDNIHLFHQGKTGSAVNISLCDNVSMNNVFIDTDTTSRVVNISSGSTNVNLSNFNIVQVSPGLQAALEINAAASGISVNNFISIGSSIINNGVNTSVQTLI